LVVVRFEDYAAELLSRLGFRAIDRRVKVMGVEVGEIDLIAEDECGNRYSV